MAYPRQGARVTGPYYDKRRDQWRFKVILHDGRESWQVLSPGSTRESAEKAVTEARTLLGPTPEPVTVSGAMDMYCSHLETQELDGKTIAFERHAAKALTDARGDAEVGALRVSDLEEYLADIAKERLHGKTKKIPTLSAQRSYWLAMRRICRYWHTAKLTKTDLGLALAEQRKRQSLPLPWETKKGRRELGRGKPQLRNMEEAEKYTATAMLEPTAERRAGAALPLLTGICSGELLHLRREDIDLRLRCIWVRSEESSEGWHVKRASRERKLEMPPVLAQDLEALRDSTEACGYLFRQEDGRPRSPTWLLKLCKSVAKRAGVRYSPPHGLRGTHASMVADESEASAARIGQRLGHADGGETAKESYLGTPVKERALEMPAKKEKKS